MTPAPDPRCPHCGSALEIVTDGLVSVPYAQRVATINGQAQSAIDWRLVARPFAACTGCEFCLEIGVTP